MKRFFEKCTYIFVLQVVLLVAAYPNSLVVNEHGDVFAETDRYSARFENGVLVHFYNKLTEETYTQGKFIGDESDYSWPTELNAADRSLYTTSIISEIKRHSPLECELIYRESFSVPQANEVTLNLFISIDVKTGDLLIWQEASSKIGAINHVAWGVSNLSRTIVDVIAPIEGGQKITHFDTYLSEYPGYWEAQLAVLQGHRGGVFVYSDDTQYQFKSLELTSKGNSFALSFGYTPPAPIEQQKEATTVTWRLNAYEGGWEVPALAYRKWMEKALKPADRTKMPAWINDIELIIRFPPYHNDMEAGILQKISQLINPKNTLLYVHDWRESGWEQNYPDYTPVTSFANFGEVVREAHRYGFKVMPHVNMVAISLSNPLYAEFEKHQMHHPWTGEKILGVPLSGIAHGYAWINPASSSFRKLLVDQLKSVWETYRVDAFHLDISWVILNNSPIDDLTMAEGNILLHKELRDAMPGIVLGGERFNEVTFLYESLAQLPGTPPEHPHPINDFLFSHYVRFYGHLGVPNPDRNPKEFHEYQKKYRELGSIPVLVLHGISDLDSDRVETHKLLEMIRTQQNWAFGDINSDGVVNILDLTLVAKHFGTSNQEADVNKDGIVNILDLVAIAQHLA